MVICVRIIRCSYVFQHINISTQSFQQKILHKKTCLKTFLTRNCPKQQISFKNSSCPITNPFTIQSSYDWSISRACTQRELFPFTSGCHTYFKILPYHTSSKSSTVKAKFYTFQCKYHWLFLSETSLARPVLFKNLTCLNWRFDNPICECEKISETAAANPNISIFGTAVRFCEDLARE